MNSGIALEGAAMWEPKSFHFAALLDFNVGVLALKLGDEKLGNLIPFRTDVHFMFAYQLLERLELAADLPVTAINLNDFNLLAARGFPETPPAFAGLGSVRLLPRISILNRAKFPLGLAGIAELRLPSPSENDFMGDSGFVFAPRLAAELGIGPVRVLANAGYRLRPSHVQYLNLYVGHEFVAGGGAVLDLPSIKTFTDNQFIAEMHMATPTVAAFNFSQSDSLKTPWELLVGLRSRVHGRWGAEVTLARGIGLVSGYGREDFRAMLGIRYDFRFADRDGDGVTDEVDKCPDVAEDKDGFQDADGCPEDDNDHDGVPDKSDGCPNDPGPEEFEGCPDRDGDQIPDHVDKCPDEPGPAETEGCPLEDEPAVVLESDRIRIRGQILFETAEAIIQKQSYPMLDDVYKVLADNPEIGPVLIEGHTDNRGSRPYNLDLSKRRAQAVVDYLVAKGIAKKRLKSAGFGFDRPVADNETPLGRAKNRRTEFKLVEEDGDAKDKDDKDDKGKAPKAKAPKAKDDKPKDDKAKDPKGSKPDEAAPAPLVPPKANEFKDPAAPAPAKAPKPTEKPAAAKPAATKPAAAKPAAAKPGR